MNHSRVPTRWWACAPRTLICCAWAWLLCASAGAATIEPAFTAMEPLVLEKALAAALAQHTAVAHARQSGDAARRFAQTSSGVAAPELKLTADRDTRAASNGTQPVRSKIELNWAPPQMGAQSLRQQQLNRLVDQADQATVAARQRVAFDVRQLHATWTMLQAMQDWSSQALDLQRRLVETAERQASSGRRTRQAVIEVRLQGQAVESAHGDLLAEQVAVRRRLLALMGQPDNPALTAPPRGAVMASGDSAVDLPALIAAAQREHPERVAVQARCAALDAETHLKELENRRWLKSVGATYAPPSGTRSANVALTTEFTLPMTGDRHGDSDTLAAQRNACQAAWEDLGFSIGQQVQAAEFQRARAIRTARLQLRQLAGMREMARLTEAARAAGRADEVELLNAKLQVAQGHIQALRRMLDAEMAALSLQHALGRSLAES